MRGIKPSRCRPSAAHNSGKFTGNLVIVKGNGILNELLNYYGVNFVFTGHFHAQDIVLERSGLFKNNLYDIETGSLVTYQAPYRIIDMGTPEYASVTTGYITFTKSISDLRTYSLDFIMLGVEKILALLNETLKKYFLPLKDIKVFQRAILNLYIDHLKGDEKKPA